MNEAGTAFFAADGLARGFLRWEVTVALWLTPPTRASATLATFIPLGAGVIRLASDAARRCGRRRGVIEAGKIPLGGRRPVADSTDPAIVIAAAARFA